MTYVNDASDEDQQRVVPQITEKQAKRLNTPLRAIIITMVALLAITLPFVWLQPRPDNQSYRPEVDVAQTAAEASREAGYPVVDPQLEEPWHANFARWNAGATDGVAFWEVGYVTPSGGFITVTQTGDSNPTWLAQRTDSAPATGSVEAGGATWETRVSRAADADETVTSYVGELEGTTVILSGTASDADFEDLSGAVVEHAGQPASADASDPAPAG